MQCWRIDNITEVQEVKNPIIEIEKNTNKIIELKLKIKEFLLKKHGER